MPLSPLFENSRTARWLFNLYPPFLFTATHILHIAPDWSSVRVRMLLLLTRNAVGVQFGGALYAMCDPWYMMMLLRQMGPDYIVWDKAATIRFIRPGKGTVYATFTISGDEVQAIRDTLATKRKMDVTFTANIFDSAGEVVAEVEKVLYVRRKSARLQRA